MSAYVFRSDSQVCQHEAAHAIAAAALGVPVTVLSLTHVGRRAPYCEVEEENHPPLIGAIIGAAGPIWDEHNGLGSDDLNDWDKVQRYAQQAATTIAKVRRITRRILRNHQGAVVKLAWTLLQAGHLTGSTLSKALADAERRCGA